MAAAGRGQGMAARWVGATPLLRCGEEVTRRCATRLFLCDIHDASVRWGALQEVSIHYIAHVIGTMKGRTSQAHVYGSYLLGQDLMESAFAQDVMSC